MRDPYDVLGISRNATDDEVKSAYRDLARKYHPDNVANSANPAASELFEEKMKEINEAYDTIVTNRRNGTDRAESYSSTSGNTAGGASYGYSAGYSNNSSSAGASSSSNTSGRSYYSSSANTTSFSDVRQMINNKRYNEAEELLDGVPMTRRNAEWYFLRGTVLYHRGWVEQAYEHFSQAVQLDPSNAEFRSAYNVVQSQRSGKRGGYVYDTDRAERGCNPLSMCCGMFCADSCCECCGGDMISCC